MKKAIILFLIPLLWGCNVHDDNGIILHQLSNQTHSQMMSYVIETESGKTIVIDGGTEGNFDYLMDKIKAVSPDNHIDAWFITHYHKDHTGALKAYYEREYDEVTIGNIYCNLPPQEWIALNEPGRLNEYIGINQHLENNAIVNSTKKDMVIKFDHLQVKVLNDYNLSLTENAGNNSSIVYKVMTSKNSILFLGDLGVEAGELLLHDKMDEIKNMDYVQMAHHGQAGVNEAFYQVVNPRYCLWPTTDWIWDSDYLKTNETKEWMEKLNVEAHYIANNGTISIEID